MGKEPDGYRPGATRSETAFSKQIRAQEARKVRALRRAEQSIWFGFGMSGLIGWSVAIPAVTGAMLGLWLDKRYPGNHSWTLALLAAGLVLGCWNAWNWVNREDKAMLEEPEQDNELGAQLGADASGASDNRGESGFGVKR